MKLLVSYGEIDDFARRREDTKERMRGLFCITWRLGVLVQRESARWRGGRQCNAVAMRLLPPLIVPLSLMFSLIPAGLHAAESPRPLLRELLGINGHAVLFKPDTYQALTRMVRDYHPMEWDLNGRTDTMPAFPFTRNRLDWSASYGSWRKAGYDVHCCLLFDSIKAADWIDPTLNGKAYGLAFAGAFGPSAPGALVSSVEIGNEPSGYTNDQYRTLFAALAAGVRAGDPRLQIASCAVTTGPSTPRARSIECFRDFDHLLDVITIHPSARLEERPTWGSTFPEDPAITYLKEVRDVLSWRERNAPGKPVWITEYGWDCSTRRPDQNGPFAKWSGVTDQQQAQWLVRATLLFATLDVQRVYLQAADDADEPGPDRSAGITRNGTAKPSFHALAHLVATLGDYRFAGIIRQDADAVVLRFRSAADELKTLVVAWSPTGDERSVAFTTPLPADRRVVRMQRMPLTAAQTEDLPAPPTAADGTVTVTLTESPLYVWLDAR